MENKGKRKLAAVMFTDIEGYTDLVAKNEDRALAFVRKHRDSLTRHTEANHGEVIEFYGDGSLSVYGSAVHAVQCAIAMQEDYRQSTDVIPVRIGIHLGDIVQRDGSIFGNGVNVASRIESIGIAGNILVSESIADELKNQNHIDSQFLGKYEFKNVDKPLGVYGIKHEHVVMPAKKQLVGPKGKAVKQKTLPFIILGILAVLVFVGYFVLSTKKPAQATEFLEDRIAILPFKNFTGNSDLDFIGEMTAHWLTKELLETENANVVSFHSQNEIEQFTSSIASEASEKYAKQAGALNILEGSFSITHVDSLEFSAYVKRLKSGNVEHAFKPVSFAKTDPALGIKKLSSFIKGYWDAHDDKLLSMPSFDAYKAYIEAKNIYLKDTPKAQKYLLASIQLDSSFLDPYFLLLGSFVRDLEYEKAEQLVNMLTAKPTSLSSTQKNILAYELADLEGKNKKVFEIALKDMQEHDRDLFTVIEYMVFAFDYVNEPTELIRIYEESSLPNIDIEDCPFCILSQFLLISAYNKIGAFDKALETIVSIPDASKNRGYYSRYIKLLSTTGAFNELKTIINEAKETLPTTDHTFVDYMAARELFINNHKEQSAEYASKVIQSEKENEYLLGWANYFIGNKEQALVHFNKEAKAYPEDIFTLGHIGAIQAMLGNSKEAESIIDQLDQMKQKYDFGDTPYRQSVIRLHLGEKETALDLLQQAVDEGAKFYTNNVFDQDPMLQSIVDEARFQRIIHPMGEK